MRAGSAREAFSQAFNNERSEESASKVMVVVKRPWTEPPDNTANTDSSATGGIHVSPDRPDGLQEFRVGGVSAQEQRRQQIIYAGTSLGAEAVGLSATAAPGVVAAASSTMRFAANLTVNTRNTRMGTAMFLELNATHGSFVNQFVVVNAARQIQTVYVPYISREPIRRATYAVMRPK